MHYIIGIDNSKSSHSATIIDSHGKFFNQIELQNNFSGFQILKSKILQLQNDAKISVGMELSHGPIIDFLRKNDIDVYSINPLKIKRYKETHIVSGNKTDSVDSLAIALFLKTNIEKLNPKIFNSDEIEKLNRLDIAYERLVKDRVKYTNRLIFVLNQYFPLYTELFSSNNVPILLKFIKKYPSWTILEAESNINIIQFLKSNSYRNPKYIDKILEKIENYNQEISMSEEFSSSIEARGIADILLLLNKNISEIRNEIKTIKDKHELKDIFDSLPGAGDLLSSKLLSIFGDVPTRWKNASNIQCLYGTSPRNYQSGKYHKVLCRKACNKRGRYILYQFAFSSIKHCFWAREYYNKCKERSKKHAAAIRALSNKWVKIIFQMWKYKKVYCEKKLNYLSMVA